VCDFGISCVAVFLGEVAGALWNAGVDDVVVAPESVVGARSGSVRCGERAVVHNVDTGRTAHLARNGGRANDNIAAAGRARRLVALPHENDHAVAVADTIDTRRHNLLPIE
jgi:hypothetical protein